MIENRNGHAVSPQISTIGEITFENNENFKTGEPFCVKNEGTQSIDLVVNLWGMEEGTFIRTTFEAGWNPEIVREIQPANITNNRLLWGN